MSQDGVSNSGTLLAVFKRRKKLFLESLRHILEATGNDNFIRQMFDDPTSAVYVPQRICELIERYLYDDRENNIGKLYKQITAIEACLGTNRVENLKKIGRRLLNLSENQDGEIQKREKYIAALQAQLEDLQSELGYKQENQVMVVKEPIKVNPEMRSAVRIVAGELIALAKYVKAMEKELHQNINDVRDQVAAFVTASIAHFRISQQNAAELTSDIHVAHRQFTEIDIPKLQKSYEDEIEKIQQKELEAQRELKKAKRETLRATRKVNQLEDELSSCKTQIAELESSYIDPNSYEQEISNLKGQVNALTDQLKQSQMKIDDLVSDSLATTSIDTAHQSALISSKLHLKDKDEIIQKQRETIQQLNLTIDDLTHDKSMMNAEIQMLKTQLQELPRIQKECELTKNNQESLRAQNEDLRKRVAIAELKSTEAENEMAKMKEKIVSIIESNTIKAHLEDEIECLNEQIESLKKQNEENEHEKLEQSKEIQKQKQTISKLTEENGNLQSSIALVNENLDQVNDQAKEFEDHLIYQKKLNEELQCIRQMQVNKIAQLENDFQAISNENDATNAQLQAANDEIGKCANYIQEKEQMIKKMEATVKQFHQKLKQVNAELSQAKEAEKIAEQNKLILDDKIKSLNSENQTLRDTIASTSQQVQVLTKRNNELSNQVHQDQIQIVQKEGSVKALTQEVLDAKTQNSKLREQLEKRKNLLDQSKQEIDDIKLKMLKIESNAQAKADAYEKLQAMQSQMKKDAEAIAQQSASERAQHVQNLREANEKLLEARKENNTLKRKTELMQYEKQSMEQQLQHKCQEIQLQKDHINSQAEQLRKQNKELSSSLADKEAKFKSLEGKVQEALKNVNEYSSVSSLNDLKHVAKKAKESQEYVSQIGQIVNATDPNDIVKKVKDLKINHEDLSQSMSSLMKTGGASTPEDLQKKIAKLSSENEQYEKREKELSKVLPGSSVSDIPKVVEQIKKDKEEAHEKLNKLSRIMGSGQGDLVQQVEEMKDQINDIKEIVGNNPVQATLLLKKEHEELKKFTEQASSIIPSQFVGETLPEQVGKLVEAYQKQTDEFRQIEKSLPADLDGSPIERVSKISKEWQDVRKQVGKEASIPALVQKLVEDKDRLAKNESQVRSILGEDDIVRASKKMKEKADQISRISGSKDIVRAVTQLQKEHDEIVRTTGKQDLTSAVSQLQKEHNEIAKAFGTEDIISVSKEAASHQKELQGILNSHNIVKAAQDLVSEKADLIEKCDKLNQKALSLQSTIESVKKAAGTSQSEDPITAVQDLRSKFDSASSLLNQALKELNDAPKSFQYPIDQTSSKQFIDTIIRYREKVRELGAKIQNVLDKARDSGYVGAVLIEAVEFLITSAVDLEKQNGLERMHKELTDVRTIQEKERSVFERHKAKLNQKLEEERNQVAIINEKMNAREEEVLKLIEEEQAKARAMKNTCDKTLKVKEELMRVIRGDAIDLEILRSNLSAQDFHIVQTADAKRSFK